MGPARDSNVDQVGSSMLVGFRLGSPLLSSYDPARHLLDGLTGGRAAPVKEARGVGMSRQCAVSSARQGSVLSQQSAE